MAEFSGDIDKGGSRDECFFDDSINFRLADGTGFGHDERSGSSPIGVAMDKIKLHCPKAKVLDGLTANGGVNVEGWVQKLGYGR